MAVEPPDLSKDELIRRGTDATAFVDFTGYSGSFASALCVHPSGLFVTNAEPFVRPGVTFDTVRLVIRPGRPDQSVHDAAVLCRLADPGLTLLRVDGAAGLVAPPLAPPGTIDELMDVAVFDVPALPGRGWDAKKAYPPVRAGEGSVSAIQKQGGGLYRIQFDAPLSPGSTGGPLLDAKGRVLGVILGRVRAGVGEGVGLAVPANRLDQFLNHAEVTFTPPEVDAENLRRPALFRARAMTFFPSKGPLEVALILGGLPTGKHQFPMTLKDGTTKPPPSLSPLLSPPRRFGWKRCTMTARSRRGWRTGRSRSTAPGPSGLARSASSASGPGPSRCSATGRRSKGPPSPGWARWPRPSAGRHSRSTWIVRRRSRSSRPKNSPPSPARWSPAGRPRAGRESTLIYAADRVSPCLEALRDGRFIRPARGDSPVTYLTFEGGTRSTPGPGPSAAFGPGAFRAALAEHKNYAVIDRSAGVVRAPGGPTRGGGSSSRPPRAARPAGGSSYSKHPTAETSSPAITSAPAGWTSAAWRPRSSSSRLRG